jgi:hypothetical protein
MVEQLNTIFKCNFLDGYDVILVCGLYKTGTSLLTEIIENSFSFKNPASKTNPYGMTIGVTTPRYYTRECLVLRRLNAHLMLGKKNSIDIKAYLTNLEKPTVIKDGQFCFTLSLWQDVLNSLDYKVLTLFTCRNKKDIIHSWDNARHRNGLLKGNAFDGFYQAFQKQRLHSKLTNQPHINLTYQDILRANELFNGMK